MTCDQRGSFMANRKKMDNYTYNENRMTAV